VVNILYVYIRFSVNNSTWRTTVPDEQQCLMNNSAWWTAVLDEQQIVKNGRWLRDAKHDFLTLCITSPVLYNINTFVHRIASVPSLIYIKYCLRNCCSSGTVVHQVLLFITNCCSLGTVVHQAQLFIRYCCSSGTVNSTWWTTVPDEQQFLMNTSSWWTTVPDE
jgi:hypothetical protein